MIPILYDFTESAFTSNGLCRLRDCISCIVTEERNGLYELDFTYPVNGENFEKIIPGRTVGVTHDDTGDLQPFDIVSYSKPIDGIMTFHAVHLSYRLTGQVVSSSSISSLEDALDLFRSVSGTPFSYARRFAATGYMAAADGVPRTVRQMLGGIEGSVLDTYGGELEFDKWSVVVHKARGQARDLTIRYGVNMTDFNDESDYSGSYTSAVPYWTGTDNAGGTIVVIGNEVASGLVSYSTRYDRTVPLDLTDKFETKPSAAQLEALAKTYMKANQVNLPAQSITVDFIRLQDTADYEALSALFKCNLCDTVSVVFPTYGINGRYKIVKTEYDVLSDRYESMELGTLSTTLSEALGITETSEKFRAIGDWAVGGDLTVAGDASVVGGITTNGDVSIATNNKAIRLTDTGGTLRSMVYLSSNNYFGLGYGLYDANAGETRIYGDTLRLYSHNAITFNQPLSALYQVTTESGTVPATGAHTYSTNLSASMTAPAGYNAVGIVGWQSSNFRLYPFRCEVASNSSITFGVTNSTATATSNSTTMSFQVLWLKATSA